MSVTTFETTRYKLEIELDEEVGRIVLTDNYSGVAFADAPYRYSVFVEHNSEVIRLDGLCAPQLSEKLPDRGGKIVTVRGRLGSCDDIPSINVRHRFYLPEDGEFLEEQVGLLNAGNADLVLLDYRFGFRKKLAIPRTYGGPGIDIEDYRIIALPFRLQPDGKKHDYRLDEVYHGRYQCSVFDNPVRLKQEVVDRGRGRSEGWAWTDGENGLLIVKYNPDMIEFSMLETETIGDQAHLNFGGASPCLFGEPIEMRQLRAGHPVAFGHTRYHFYEGLWRRGAIMFREYMTSLGHGLPENYDPPIHWNELYGIGWHHNDPDKLRERYSLENLEREAAKATEMGCEALYLDPGWETCEGSTTWDEERLGEAAEFVKKMDSDHGLKVAFRTIGRSYCDDYPGMYRRDFDGETGYYAPYLPKPFHEPCVCSRQYKEDKLSRILKMADAGMSFIMFDEFDWRGPCFDPSHGHPVPTTPGMHAKAVMELVRKVHEKHPEIDIEAHDPVWPWGVRYLPVYYLHDSADSFDEAWAFEFMWHPLEDLISGKALSLFYYNLAYDLPMYLHINMDNDNDNCLAFWWYASTVRHLGIGGKADDKGRREAYKTAMVEYKSCKDLYTQGHFNAVDELTHIHVLAEEGRAVINAFNLTDTHMSREVSIRLNDLGLLQKMKVEGTSHKLVGGKLVLKFEIPPFSPLVVKLTPE